MSEAETTTSPDFRCGYVTIIGEPNVGKSTLMNGLLEQKISIVTNKPQTTRHKVLGILSTGEHQIIFLDTPGIIRPRYLLHEMMMQFATSAIDDADVLLFMIDATDPKTSGDLAHEEAFRKLKGFNKPVFLVINKVDIVGKSGLLPVIDFYSRAFPFKEIFPISALKLDGTADLVKTIVPLLPQHPPLYPIDIVSEQSERFFVSEIIREKIFLTTKEEVPYSTTVDIVEFKEREAGKTFISADIYVERDSQKGILIGKQGSALKNIGQRARKDIETFLGRPVFLELHVKVRQWRGDEKWLARLGYKA
ncbi:MAG: GTPase Era [Bacteroidota bacterium]